MRSGSAERVLVPVWPLLLTTLRTHARDTTGTWSLATVAALVPGKSAAGVRGSAPAGTPDDAWATALMLAVLKLHFAAKRAEWSILARKARRALTAALGEAMADVAAAAEAFVMG